MWFADELVAQPQVRRNQVSGYRVETAIYGDAGQVQIGWLLQKPEEVVVEALAVAGEENGLRSTFAPGRPACAISNCSGDVEDAHAD
jgi:hypothetical protein